MQTIAKTKATAPPQFNLIFNGEEVPVKLLPPTVAVRREFAIILGDTLNQLDKLNSEYEDIHSLDKLKIAYDENGLPRIDPSGSVIKYCESSSYERTKLAHRFGEYRMKMGELQIKANIEYMPIIIDWSALEQTHPELVEEAKKEEFWTESQDIEMLEKIVEFFREKARI